jgi:YihY family inner membrane protein
VSTAAPVPETWELTGDDARDALLGRGRRGLLSDAFLRLRAADGFSHARSTAFLVTLLLVQTVIALVGLAVALGDTRVSSGIVTSVRNAVPGPAGELLTSAVGQASSVGHSKRYLGLAVGLVGTAVSATTVLGQLERSLNRIYGVEQDRPLLQKYGRALALAVSLGVLVAVAFVAIGFGTAVGDNLRNGWISTTWALLRWPLGIAVMSAAIALLFRWCPRRHQPAWSWLAYGSTVSVLLWVAVTVAMGLAFRLTTEFGATYGWLAGIVALQLWSYFSTVAVLYGGAVAAQLEAVRAGQPGPCTDERATGTALDLRVEGPVDREPVAPVAAV